VRFLAYCLFFLVLAATQMAGQTAAGARQTVGSEVRSWSGNLIDISRTECGAETERALPKGVCPVSMRTTALGLMLPDGKVLKFDEGGNSKALDALRKSRKGSKAVFDYWRTGKTRLTVRARVTGTQTSDTLNLDSIRVD
jgi:hypothetical protein